MTVTYARSKTFHKDILTVRKGSLFDDIIYSLSQNFFAEILFYSIGIAAAQ